MQGTAPTLRALVLLSFVLLAGCSISPAKKARVQARIAQSPAEMPDCRPPAPCLAAGSPWHALIDADDGRHRALTLNVGADALRLRLHLIRAARHSIELQTFIFQDEASTELLLREMLSAAARGVRVRLLVDQLFSLNDPRRLAQLALAHRNFELRFYNPTFSEARTQSWEFAAGLLCCFSRFNQRMHNKLFAIDGGLAIIGGRNYRDSYFDLDPDFAYYDRELLVTGPVAAQMIASFERFWRHPRAIPVAHLSDVAGVLLRGGERDGPLVQARADDGRLRERLQAMSRDADDTGLIRRRFIEPLHTVEHMRFVSDTPAKIGSRRPDANAASLAIAQVLEQARREVLLQTPYLVLGRDTRELFKRHREHNPQLTVRVSTNSLAATDAYPVYALSYKYKKRYLRELGFRIHELRPDPADRADLVETPAGTDPPRVSLHGKSLVVDRRIALVGTHNFDPRSDRFNTEAAVIIEDRGYAEELARVIERDMAPGNSWVIAPRQRRNPAWRWLTRAMESISTALPVFDLWPFRYASSFEPSRHCPPIPREHPDFHRCYRDVGDFPGVDNILERIRARLAAAFGAPLVPVL